MFLDDLSCEELVEPVSEATPNRAEQVLAYQAACLTLPPRCATSKWTYGVYARANDCPADREVQPENSWSTSPVDVTPHDWDAFAHEYNRALMLDLIRAIDSLSATLRKDTIVVMP